MVEVRIENRMAVFEVLGLHKFWALKGRLEVPLIHIRGVHRADPTVTRGCWKGWRMGGTHVPGLIVAGTYRQGDRRAFWGVVRSHRAIVVELTDESNDELIVEVADPVATVQRVQAALG